MNKAGITIQLDNPRQLYFPGDLLAGWYRLSGDDLPQLQKLEISVLWHTEGKGDEDMGVHFFEQLSPEQYQDAAEMRRFSTPLPQSPLSFDGLLVKIVWLVRVRAELQDGRERVGEAQFRLGDVPQPNDIEPFARN